MSNRRLDCDFRGLSGNCLRAALSIAFGILFGAPISADEPAVQSPASRQQARLVEMNRLWKKSNALIDDNQWKDAAKEADKALALARDTVIDRPALFVTWLDFAAKTHEGADDLATARKLREEMLAIQMKRLAKDHWQVTDARLALAKTDLLEELDASQRHQLADSDRLASRCHALYMQGNFPAALELSLTVEKTRRAILGESHLDYATSLQNEAQLRMAMGDYAKPEPLFQQSLSIEKLVLGEKHPDYAMTMNSLAALYDNRGDFAKAEPLFRQALAIDKEAFAERHFDYAMTLNNLAALYEHMGDFAQAEPLYMQALAIKSGAGNLGGKASLLRDRFEQSGPTLPNDEGVREGRASIPTSPGNSQGSARRKAPRLHRQSDDIGRFLRRHGRIRQS